MQHDFVSPGNSDSIVPSSVSPLMFLPTDLTIPSPQYLSGCDFPDFFSQDSHMVNQYSVSPPIQGPGKTPVTFSAIPLSVDDENSVSIKNQRLYLSRLALQYQQIAERYVFYHSQLEEAEREAETISKQNTNLRRINEKLYRWLSLNSTKHKYRNPMTGEYPSMSLLDDQFRRISLAEPPDEASPTSVFGFQNNRICRKSPSIDDKRITLPKSISVRSTGYLKIHQIGGSSSESSRKISHRPITPLMQQKVRLGGAEKNDGAKAENDVEVDVYGQGMFKTELCNKWQESGECPYGEHCQFAHGLDELRPIIRHPRYKTELCRMILTGDACPYGHRCHFRHVLSPHDRLLHHT